MTQEFHEVTKQIYMIGSNIEEQHKRIREQLLHIRRNDVDKLLAGTDPHPLKDNKWKAHMYEIHALGDEWSLDQEQPPWEDRSPPSRIPLRISSNLIKSPTRKKPECPNGLRPKMCLCQKPK
ncbi:uncharacterized protein LOC126195076 [Schistocerca nitens]|uniref:uncharacterized protein LOC126195076 n=1 Tax=Schistocerca nitens TaxID=7011 RepID=UPI0021191852|nr:uncharacterized protein LOC126195076 [Schistocerca nitens]